MILTLVNPLFISNKSTGRRVKLLFSIFQSLYPLIGKNLRFGYKWKER